MSTTSRRASGAAFRESAMSEDEDEMLWIEEFCRRRGNEYICEVSPDFILDRFNLTHIGLESPKFQQAYDLITDNYVGELTETGDVPHGIQSSAKQLYGAIHQRFVQSPAGLAQIHQKYTNKIFGSCPRVLCGGQPLLPTGLSDRFAMDTVKLYCMCCEDLYLPKSTAHNALDGAFFGTSLPQLYILSMKIELMPYKERYVKYVPRVFGFAIADPEAVASIDQKEAEREAASAAA